MSGIPVVMLEAMKPFVPDKARRNEALQAAVAAGKQFLVEVGHFPEKGVDLTQLHEAAEEIWELYVRVLKSRLLPKEVRESLPPLYSQEHVADPLVMCKFFTPDSGWTWYAYEFDGLDLFFGWVVGAEKEFGYFTLHELEAYRSPLGVVIERDLHFSPTRLSEVRKLHTDQEASALTLVVLPLLETTGEDELAAQALDREFVVTTLCRDDLIEGLGATVEDLVLLSDDDLEQIASQIGEAYVQRGQFWEDVCSAVNKLLQERGGRSLSLREDEDE